MIRVIVVEGCLAVEVASVERRIVILIVVAGL
jgi:hypothetical protein